MPSRDCTDDFILEISIYLASLNFSTEKNENNFCTSVHNRNMT